MLGIQLFVLADHGEYEGASVSKWASEIADLYN